MKKKKSKLCITKGSIPYCILVLGICFSIVQDGVVASLMKVVMPAVFYLTGDELQKVETIKQVKEWDFIEGRDEEYKQIPDGALEYQDGSLHLSTEMMNLLDKENAQNAYGVDAGLLDEMQKEQNGKLELDKTNAIGKRTFSNEDGACNPYEEVDKHYSEDTPQNTPNEEWFSPLEGPVYQYKKEDLQDYDSVVKAFFAIDESTKTTVEELDLANLLKKDCCINKQSDAPQILIYHTHASEVYEGMNGQEDSASVVQVGEYLTTLLKEKYGYSVLHHTEVYDEDRDYAYTEALPNIETLLKENPSIQLVIDLHRDEMAKERRLVTNIQGKECAQYMFFCGMSRLRKSGEIEYLSNPYRQDNLDLAFRMQLASNQYYPGIARRIYLKAYRYNMHLCDKSLLIELGAQNNTYEEACNSCEPLAHVIDLVLSGETLSPE